jgi:hypothetical protein
VSIWASGWPGWAGGGRVKSAIEAWDVVMGLVAAIESIAIVMSALLPAVLGRMKRIGAADAVKLHSWAVVHRVQ